MEGRAGTKPSRQELTWQLERQRGRARVAGAQRGGRRTVDVAGAAAGAFRPQRAL